jgi:hypothetical protein
MWAHEEISYGWEWTRDGEKGEEGNDFIMKMCKEANWLCSEWGRHWASQREMMYVSGEWNH